MRQGSVPVTRAVVPPARATLTSILWLLALVPGAKVAQGASISAEDIARRMIDQNGTVSNFEGSFQYARRLRTGTRELEAQFNAMMESELSPANKQAVAHVRDRQIADIKKDGFLDDAEVYTGVFVDGSTFRLQEASLGADGEAAVTTFILNGERGIRYSEEARHALIGTVAGRRNPIGEIAGRMLPVEQWKRRPNQIETPEKVSIVKHAQVDGQDAIILRQEPTEFSLNRFVITHTVIPAYGYLAIQSEFHDVETGALIRRIENKDVRQLQAGVWRPMVVEDARFLPAPQDRNPAESIRTLITFQDNPKINQRVPESTFDITVPSEVTRLVDTSVDANAPLELEVDGEVFRSGGGIEGIEAFIATEHVEAASRAPVPDGAKTRSDGSRSETPPVSVLGDLADEGGGRPRLLLRLVIVASLLAALFVWQWRRRSRATPGSAKEAS